ncbi:hypothetical protein FNF27_05389 [Cafeteria roenbergensis]|uniref:Activator of Hsp90 ATPase homologue 1/2-like C-terminal domain-containing protein n=1 Tax=Cafeteria roenbergensis TaxID=33653 RepID=A0A5A8DYK6_CAFRO|nr:hypothetical protein FNF28_01944 [Cafeteria roenbergensis]KAA0173165.1 hypothetical protein FNF27_05389 [Cafeteria roenbergensis]
MAAAATGACDFSKPSAAAGKEATTFSHEVTYHASCEAVYRALTDTYDLSRMMRAPATSDTKVGGEFSWMGGAISGKYTVLEKDSKIGMVWRMRDWADQVYSTVTIALEADGHGVCKLSLKQDGIPVTDKFGNGGTDRATKNGWKERILVVGLSKIIGFALREEDDE